MRRPPNHGAAEPANGATYSFFKKGSWEKILIFFLRAGCPAPVSPLLFAMRLLPYQDTTQLLHARTLDDYGIMALTLDLESGSTKNGCVGCRKIKEEELRKKSALRNSMVDSLVEKSQSICKSLILTVFYLFRFLSFFSFACRSSIIIDYRMQHARNRSRSRCRPTKQQPYPQSPSRPSLPTQHKSIYIPAFWNIVVSVHYYAVPVSLFCPGCLFGTCIM